MFAKPGTDHRSGGQSLVLFIGLRYTFSRQRNRFIAVVSMVSLVGMALGVASLITVLSVMNGFSEELRSRILSLIPHGFVERNEASLDNWQTLAAELQARPDIVAVAPYIRSKVLLGANGRVRGAELTGVDPVLEQQVEEECVLVL